MSVSALERKQMYSCCNEPYSDLFFTIRLRRKALFYTFSLLIPCFSLSFISVFVFYLPPNSGEKVSKYFLFFEYPFSIILSSFHLLFIIELNTHSLIYQFLIYRFSPSLLLIFFNYTCYILFLFFFYFFLLI